MASLSFGKCVCVVYLYLLIKFQFNSYSNLNYTCHLNFRLSVTLSLISPKVIDKTLNFTILHLTLVQKRTVVHNTLIGLACAPHMHLRKGQNEKK